MTQVKVLVVDDDPVVLESLSEALRLEGYEVTSTDRGREAIKQLNREDFRAAVLDVSLPDISGLSVLDYVREHVPFLPVIMMTGFGSVRDAVQAVRIGAIDYLLKPVSTEQLLRQLHSVLEAGSKAREELDGDRCHLIGNCEPTRQLRELVRQTAPTDATVLVTGEAGVGKTLVARYLHQCSKRREQAYVEVDVMNMMDSLLESELYGHMEGAFTGAHAQRTGKLGSADAGTLLLDNIDRASIKLQASLLGFLQDHTFTPLGSNESRSVDVRVVLTSTKDLGGMVERGEFREDLYHRVNKISIRVPALSERMEDVALLARHFLRRFGLAHGRRLAGLTEECEQTLKRHAWPGNVRELESVIEQACLRCKNSYLTMEDLPETLRRQALKPAVQDIVPLKTALAACEKELIEWALEQTEGNRPQAAELLEINRTTLSNKVRRYGIRTSGPMKPGPTSREEEEREPEMGERSNG